MKLLKNPYGCAVCLESFTIAEDLLSHFKTKHEAVECIEKEKNIKDLI